MNKDYYCKLLFFLPQIIFYFAKIMTFIFNIFVDANYSSILNEGGEKPIEYGLDGRRKSSRISTKNSTRGKVSPLGHGLDVYRDNSYMGALPSLKSSRKTISNPHRSPGRDDLGIVEEDENENMIMSKISRDRSLPPKPNKSYY